LHGSDARAKLAAQEILVQILQGALKLLHPFMPFITEEIYQKLLNFCPKGEPQAGPAKHPTLVLAAWPKFEESRLCEKEEAALLVLQNTIRAIRNIRAEMNIPHGKKCNVVLVAKGEEESVLKENQQYIQSLAGAEMVQVKTKTEKIDQAAAAVTPGVEIYVPLAGLIDIEKEKDRLTKVKLKMEKELIQIDQRMQNKEFIEKAPSAAVEEARGRREILEKEIRQITERLKML
jgi:valyl-tRNA synthetase